MGSDDSLGDLSLADWRRRIAELYVQVRAMSQHDPRVAWEHWKAIREELYRTHPDSPVPAEERSSFRAVHFEYVPELRFEAAPVHGAPPPEARAGFLALPNSGLDRLDFTRIGTVDVPFTLGTRTLALFWMSGYAGGLFLPFGDTTNGNQTYAAGRYLLDTAKSADLGGDIARGTLVLDFNFAFQPSCAFDPRWACPLAPPENRLDIPIDAGERV